MNRILYVHYGNDWIRGSERCLLDLLMHLDRQHFYPVVWCNSPVMADAVSALGVEVVMDDFYFLLGWEAPRFDVLSYGQLVIKCWGFVRRFDIDVIHVNSGGPCQWVVPVARLIRVPVVAHLHARYGLRERCSLGLHQVSLAVGVSAAVVQGLLDDGMPIERTQVIHNGVDAQRIKSGMAIDCRDEFSINPDELLIATVGSLIRRKGIDLLIDSVSELVIGGTKLKLLVIGDGVDGDELQQKSVLLGVQRHVIFLGERADVGALLAGGVDVFVSGAREEVFGLVLAEAGMAGLPVIAPRVGGVAEVVEDGCTGLLVDSESSLELSKAIKRLANSKALRLQMGALGRRRVKQCFSIERYVTEFQLCYEILLSVPKYRLSLFSYWPCLRTYRQWIVATVIGRIKRMGRK